MNSFTATSSLPWELTVPMTLRERAEFLHETRDAFDAHCSCARAAGKYVFYRLEDLRGVVETYLRRGDCPYCSGLLKIDNLVVGHKVPSTRGGKYTLRNLCVSCRDCSVIKGALDEQEFRELLALISQWPRALQRHFCKQLRAGASLVRTALPVCGSLAWFTGKDISEEDDISEPTPTENVS